MRYVQMDSRGSRFYLCLLCLPELTHRGSHSGYDGYDDDDFDDEGQYRQHSDTHGRSRFVGGAALGAIRPVQAAVRCPWHVRWGCSGPVQVALSDAGKHAGEELGKSETMI